MATRTQTLIPIAIAAVIIGIVGVMSIPSDSKLEAVEFPRGTIKIDDIPLQVQVADTEKPKKKKAEKKISPTNIIYTDDKIKRVEKIFRIENVNTESKKEKAGKRFQTSSASNFKIIPGFSRKGR